MRVLAAMVLMTSFGGFVCGQPVQWPLAQGGNGHWYEAVLLPQGITFGEASAMATNAGGHLATLTSSAENNFAFSLVTNIAYWFQDGAGNSQGPWIGGVQSPAGPEPAGGWGWVTGEPWAFTNWSPNEPNDYPFDTDHSQLFGLGWPNPQPTWNDVDNPVPSLLIEYPGTPPVLDYPGTGEDFELRSGVNGPPTHGAGVDVKTAQANDAIAIALISPGGAFNGVPLLLAAQIFPTGFPPSGGILAGLHLSVPGLFLLVPAGPIGWTPVLLPGGSIYGFALPGGLAGQSVLFQGGAVTPAAVNGLLALTDGHEIRVL